MNVDHIRPVGSESGVRRQEAYRRAGGVLEGLVAASKERFSWTRRAALISPLLLAACASTESGGTEGRQGRRPQSSSDRSREHRIPLQMTYGSGAAATALVPIYIQDDGPYSFALSTGAPQTAIELQLAQAFNLPAAGDTPLTPVGRFAFQPLGLSRVSRWRLDGIDLVPATVAVGVLPRSELLREVRGILGMDVLSRFASFTLDYDQRELILRR